MLDGKRTQPTQKDVDDPSVVWVQRAKIASVAWLIVASLYLLLFGAKAKSSFVLAPNEFGDLVAGIFSPLAFAWLVLAVFVQRNELRSQIEEFRSARELQLPIRQLQDIDYHFEDTIRLIGQSRNLFALARSVTPTEVHKLIDDAIAPLKPEAFQIGDKIAIMEGYANMLERLNDQLEACLTFNHGHWLIPVHMHLQKISQSLKALDERIERNEHAREFVASYWWGIRGCREITERSCNKLSKRLGLSDALDKLWDAP